MSAQLEEPQQQDDLFHLYFDYVGNNEAPKIFHRWTLISLIGALIGRNIALPFGHKHIYPNQYILLTGSPGARKGTAIGIGKNLLERIEYKHIAPNKAVKESFWKWMAGKSMYEEFQDAEESMLDWDIDTESKVTEAYVAHDEFLDFIGIGDTAFITNLTNLWDNLPHFLHPKTRGKDVRINQPTVSILSGITPGGISDTFKALASSGGFFSRILFIYSDPTTTKIAFPDPPDRSIEDKIVEKLQAIQQLQGDIVLSREVKAVLKRMYDEYPGVSDQRFVYYSQRRFTHLLKIVIIVSASRLSLTPTIQDCLLANTLLYTAERQMPTALGEYGKGRFSEVANTIINVLNNTTKPLSLRELYKTVSRDINKFTDMKDVMDSLLTAEKIIRTNTDKGIVYLPNNANENLWPEDLLDIAMLKEEEHCE